MLDICIFHAPLHHTATSHVAVDALMASFQDQGHSVVEVDAAMMTLQHGFMLDTTLSASPADRLDDPAFIDPTHSVAALARHDAVLAGVSHRFSGVEIDRHGVRHPDGIGQNDIAKLAVDPVANPFHAAVFGPVADAVPEAMSLAIVLVPSPGNALGAATLVAMIRERFPESAVACFGPKETRDAADLPAADPTDPGLASLAAERWESLNVAAASAPALPGLWPAKGALPSAMQRSFIDTDPSDFIAETVGAGVKIVEWVAPAGDASALFKHLYQASRAGLWNHLVLPAAGMNPTAEALADFAAANANIVHSWCRCDSVPSPLSDARLLFPSGSPPYGDTAAMPGIPLWQMLQSPAAVARYLVEADARTLSRRRWVPEEARWFETGADVAYRYVSPDQLSNEEMDEIVRMVAAGGSVNTTYVRHNLERAFLIAVASEEGVIVGDSSLKRPRQEYIEAVSQQTGMDMQHYLERGYTSVRPEYRGQGIGANLLAGLTDRVGDHKLFSIIAEGNTATQKMAIRNRTRRVATFYSERAGKDVSVWIPEWMIPDGTPLPPQPDVD